MGTSQNKPRWQDKLQHSDNTTINKKNWVSPSAELMKCKGRGERCEENKKERAAMDVIAETT
eukprot:14364461-Ditylum_brightwellii.AAC.1